MTDEVSHPADDLRSEESSVAYRSLFRTHPSPMMIFDVETFEILDVNDAAVRHYGYPREEFTGLDLRQIRPSEDVPRLEAAVAGTGPGLVDAGEWRHRLADGSIIDVHITTHGVEFRGHPARLVSIQDVTHRKESDERLRLLGAALHAAANAIVITDREGMIRWVNPAFTGMTGFEADEALGRTPGDLLRSGHHDTGFYRDLWATIQGGRVWRGTTVNRRKDASLYTEEQTITPVPGEDGEITHFVAVKEDVTGRHEVEAALRRSEERYRTVFDRVPVGLFRTTEDGRFVDVNPAMARILGYDSPDQLLGRSVLEIYEDPEDRTRLLSLVDAAGETHGLDLRVRRADGRSIWVRLSAAAERGADGQIEYLEGAVEDVTERRRSEDRLSVQAQLLEAVGDAVIATDAGGTIEYWSRRAEALYGWRAEEVVGRDVLDITAPADRRAEGAAIMARVLAGEVWSGEFPVRDRAGRQVPVHVTNSPILDPAGRAVGIVGVSRDLTEQRSLEAQLHHAQKLEAVGRLAGGIAHDFNNVLTAIRGHTEFLLDALGEGPLRADAETIRRSAERAGRLTQQLLAFSRKQVLQPRVIDLGEAVQEIRQLLRPILEEDIQLAIAVHPEAGHVRADPGQVEQVVLNLAVNARDAMPDGGRLTLTVRPAKHQEFAHHVPDPVEPGEYVVVEVADTGTGIAPEMLDRLFEPFFTTKPPGAGTGLGLSTAYGIVRQSGGHMAVETAVGHGTTFRVYLPRVQDPVSDVEPPAPRRDAPGRGQRILVVEDEPGVRSLIRRTLTRAEYQVFEAHAPAAALEFVRGPDAPAIDLVLTDVVMPGMSGVELVERILEVRPEMPVIFTSGYAEDDAVRRGMADQRHHFLPKPFAPSQLIGLVAEVLA